MHKIANKLLETAKPMLDKMVDDTNDEISERELDATMKVVELAHYLYEIDMMRKKIGQPDYDDMDMNPAARMDGAKKPY